MKSGQCISFQLLLCIVQQSDTAVIGLAMPWLSTVVLSVLLFCDILSISQCYKQIIPSGVLLYLSAVLRKYNYWVVNYVINCLNF